MLETPQAAMHRLEDVRPGAVVAAGDDAAFGLDHDAVAPAGIPLEPVSEHRFRTPLLVDVRMTGHRDAGVVSGIECTRRVGRRGDTRRPFATAESHAAEHQAAIADAAHLQRYRLQDKNSADTADSAVSID
jgi:hypothetical protein